MKKPALYLILIIFSLVIGSSCNEGDSGLSGLRRTPLGDGVRVSWDPFAKPVFRIPFPNDFLTRFDKDSPTKMRINIPLDSSSQFENNIRAQINGLDGFGTFAPISIAFDGLIDINTVRSILPSGGDSDYVPSSDDTVILVNINPDSEYFGSFVPMDLGRGHFPIDGFRSNGTVTTFWKNDPLQGYTNYLFPRENRELFQNDVNDPERVEFYEYESNTLFLRPIFPLKQQSTYAVILTTGLKDKDGNPVISPFPYVNHTFQTEALKRALPHIENIGITVDDITFAWVFTTQSTTKFLETVREGLDGEGPLHYIRKEFPPVIKKVIDQGINEPTKNVSLGNIEEEEDYERDYNPFILKAEFLGGLLMDLFFDMKLVDLVGLEENSPFEYIFKIHNLDYIVFGTFNSPSFLVTDNGNIDINIATGEGSVGVLEDHFDGENNVPFTLCVPKPTEENNFAEPPYPVVIFQHGNTASGFTAFALANHMASYGIATIGLDAVDHGPLFDLFGFLKNSTSEETSELFEELGLNAENVGEEFADFLFVILKATILPLLGIEAEEDEEIEDLNDLGDILFDVGFFKALLYYGRAWDANGDGVREPSESFFTANIFWTRDVILQTVVDMMQLARLIKGLGDRDGDGDIGLFEGDFNGDGVLDIGGEDKDIFYSGQSLGGIVGSLFLAVDPIVKAGVPNVGGGGLADILIRTNLTGVAKRCYLEMMGPVVVGSKDNDMDGYVKITLNDDSQDENTPSIPISENDTVVIQNQRTGDTEEIVIEEGSNGEFALNIAADIGDTLLLTVKDNPDVSVEMDIDQYHDGLGIDRNSPRFTNMISLAQMALESADPVNYAPHYNLDPLPGNMPKDVIIQIEVSDDTVPVATGLTLARAAGYINEEIHKRLIDSKVTLWGMESVQSQTIEDLKPFRESLSLSENAGLRIYNSGAHEFYLIPSGVEDVGDDGIINYKEKGYDPVTNPDPNNDNYCPDPLSPNYNPDGTEGNRSLDVSEDSVLQDKRARDNGILDPDYTQMAQKQAAILFSEGIIEDDPEKILNPLCSPFGARE